MCLARCTGWRGRSSDPPSEPRHARSDRRGTGDGPIKSFTPRGIKDSPPYLHDGRCLTLEDTVEFFNLVLTLRLTEDEKQDLVAFLRQL
jgi:cytochrome c peroxidase